MEFVGRLMFLSLLCRRYLCRRVFAKENIFLVLSRAQADLRFQSKAVPSPSLTSLACPWGDPLDGVLSVIQARCWYEGSPTTVFPHHRKKMQENAKAVTLTGECV